MKNLEQKYFLTIKEYLIRKNKDTDEYNMENDGGLISFTTNRDIDHYYIKEVHMLLIRLDEQDNHTIKDMTSSVSTLMNKYKKQYKNIAGILWIVNSISKRMMLESILSDKDKLKDQLIGKNIPDYTIFVEKNYFNKELKLIGINRVDLLEIPPLTYNALESDKKENEFKGFVFTANLRDIVQIYDQVGDELFNKNIRLGIKEQLGVDTAIKDTLQNAPEMFWYRNGGITIMCMQPNPILDRSNEIVLKQAAQKELTFSVINGAQTITAASDFYYHQDREREKNKTNNDKLATVTASEAKVLVRIIQVKSVTKQTEKEATKISISLNRQKPIKQEDIAFYNDYIYMLNEQMFKINNCSITRRKEQAFSDSDIGLVEFARARKACAGKPGEARSMSSAKLLAQGNDGFTDKDIFVKEWMENDANRELLFRKYYNPVYFAVNLSRRYETYIRLNLKDSDISEDIRTIVNNGKWYYIAFLVYLLNGNNDYDYSNFNVDISEEKLDSYFTHILSFANLLITIQTNESDWNSNTFKSSTTYELLRKSDYDNSEFYLSTHNLKDKTDVPVRL